MIRHLTLLLYKNYQFKIKIKLEYYTLQSKCFTYYYNYYNNNYYFIIFIFIIHVSCEQINIGQPTTNYMPKKHKYNKLQIKQSVVVVKFKKKRRPHKPNHQINTNKATSKVLLSKKERNKAKKKIKNIQRVCYKKKAKYSRHYRYVSVIFNTFIFRNPIYIHLYNFS